MQTMPEPDRGISISEDQSAEHIKEKHLQMIMDMQQAGRQVPAVGIDPSVVGDDLARTSVEASQRTMRKAAKKSFVMPWIPWQNKGA